MRIEVLVIPDCPSAVAARLLVDEVLDECGLTVSVIETVVSTDEEAQARSFAGSPTILVNGTDPFADAGAGVGLSCRVYRVAGALSGVPDRAALADALRSAGTS